MEYRDLLPIIIVLGAAVIGVLIEAFAPRGARRIAQLVLSMAALAGALAAVITQAGTQLIVAQGSIAVDGPALFVQGVVCVSAIVGLMFFAERQVDPAGDSFAPAAPAAVAGGGAQVLPARRVRVGVLPVRFGADLRLLRVRAVRRDRRCAGGAGGPGRPAAGRCRAHRCGPAVQDRCSAVPRLDAGRLPRGADAGDRVHGGSDQAGRVRCPGADLLR